MADESSDGQDGSPSSRAPLHLKLTVFLYLLLGLFFFVYLMLDSWSGEFWVPQKILGLSASFVLEPDFQFFMFAASGGGLGGTIYSVLGFHRHVSLRKDFETDFVWGYIYSPWMATVMGLVAFTLVQGGLLIFAPQNDGTSATRTEIGYFGFGFLAGFGWTSATEKFRQLVIQIFGDPRDLSKSFTDQENTEAETEPDKTPERS